MAAVKNVAKLVVGSLLEVMVPRLAREIESGHHTGQNIRAKKWIVQARTLRATRRGNTAEMEKAHFDYWRADVSNEFYDRFTRRFYEWFLGPHHVIVDQIEALAARRPVRQVVEIGCGDGRVLEHLAERLPGAERLVGVDINATIIDRNLRHYAGNPRLQFLAANAADWLKDNAGDGTLLVTYGGVMEYFSPEELHAMFTSLAAHANTAVALVEPVDPAHDLAADTGSHAFGVEQSFSHHHVHLLRGAGFTPRFEQEIKLGGVRWMMVLAEGPAGG